MQRRSKHTRIEDPFAQSRKHFHLYMPVNCDFNFTRDNLLAFSSTETHALPADHSRNTGFHEPETRTGIDRLNYQSCLYRIVDLWTDLANTMKIDSWTIGSGSVVGWICNHGILPWDDDVDINILNASQCRNIRTYHEELPVATTVSVGWAARKINHEWILHKAHPVLTAFKKGGFVRFTISLILTGGFPTEWYKLSHNTMTQQLSNRLWDRIGAVDITCGELHREATGMPPIDRDTVFSNISFGPITAKIIDSALAIKSHLSHQYGFVSCQEHGQE